MEHDWLAQTVAADRVSKLSERLGTHQWVRVRKRVETSIGHGSIFPGRPALSRRRGRISGGCLSTPAARGGTNVTESR
ncbi:hypothetical protein Microterr_29160 [Microbacterium terricola]|uniref:Uncharacterized protein n=1 Tax=Microbacterium terricola TaxID=344163 RepID=A0ABM8E381_9MICO|nr:hypothetical protein Microterr_29160 [Microbacterium terricola]